MQTNYSETILDTVEAFLEGAPALEEDDVQTVVCGPRFDYDMTPGARRMEVRIDGVLYAVTVEPCAED